MHACRLLLFAIVIGMLARPVSAVTLDFDDLADLDAVTTQYAGLGATFSDALVLQAGVSLNDLDFPPHSGLNVAFGETGAVGVSFTPRVSRVGLFVTYVSRVVLTAFGANDVVLGSVTSASLDNTVSSGGTPNEYLELAQPGIQRVTLSGDPASFVFDDLSFDPERTPVPEPASVTLALLSAAVGLSRVRRRRSIDL